MSDAALQLLIDAVRAAAARATPLCIRGGGTKDFYGQSLQGEVLDTAALSGILSHEPSELVVTVRAGTPLAELEAALAEQGQCLPFEPPRLGAGGTVGGMVAAGLSGPARASVGAVRDYVLGLELLNGRGELLTFGGQVMKNVAGYDLSRLMAGAWGTLGVITTVSLKVLPVAPAEATLKFECDQTEALRRLNAWGGRPLPLNASCWVEEAGIGALYLRLRGALAAVDAACRTSAASARTTPRSPPTGTPVVTSDCPGSRIARRLNACGACPCRRRRPRWTCRPGWMLRWWSGMAASAGSGPAPNTRKPCAKRRPGSGGFATLFEAAHDRSALGLNRFEPLKAPLDRIHQRLKAEFDPAGIFNRGRLGSGF